MTIPSTPDASTAPGLPAIRAPSSPAACSASAATGSAALAGGDVDGAYVAA